MTKKATCIIPAFNEEATVKGVAEVCLKTPEIDQVIVVSDGSSDNTVVEARSIKDKRLEVLDLPHNGGKGHAVAQGIKRAKNETLLFLDADLINLQPYQISSLIRPVLENQVDMTIGQDICLNKTKIAETIAFVYVNGQRALKKKYLKKYLDRIEESKYGLEILLNNIFKDKRVICVPIVSSKKLHLLKPEKETGWMTSYIKEIWQVAQAGFKNKSLDYQKRAKNKLLKTLAAYLKVNIKKIKEYLGDEESF